MFFCLVVGPLKKTLFYVCLPLPAGICSEPVCASWGLRGRQVGTMRVDRYTSTDTQLLTVFRITVDHDWGHTSIEKSHIPAYPPAVT